MASNPDFSHLDGTELEVMIVSSPQWNGILVKYLKICQHRNNMLSHDDRNCTLSLILSFGAMALTYKDSEGEVYELEFLEQQMTPKS
jgi:hypothetical protein